MFFIYLEKERKFIYEKHKPNLIRNKESISDICITMDNMNSLKRKCKSPNQIKSSKRSYVEASKVNILHFSDCILLNVLQYLDATSLYQLGRTCTRFKSLVLDKSLWIYVEGRSQPNSTEKLDFCWQNINKKTKRLLLSGSQRSQVVFLADVLNSDKLNNLTILALEHQYIKYCKFENFPSSLQEVSFKHSYIAQHKYFFNNSDNTSSMSNLKTLILDHCQWFRSQNLLHICRYPKLEILSLYMCKKLLVINSQEIHSMVESGFKSLTVIDLRFTGLGSSFLNYLYKKPNIQVIYFQRFATTYYLERYKRKLDIVHRGMKIREYSHVSDDEDNNDTSTYSLHKRFGAIDWREYNMHGIKDRTIEQFKYLKPVQESKAKPSSYLYTYPYDECKCGFFDKASGTYGTGDFASDVPSNNDNQLMSSSCLEAGDWDPESLQYKLEIEIENCKYDKNLYFILPSNIHTCHNVLFDLCTNPDWCQVQSNPKTCLQNWLYVREPRNDYEIAMLEHTNEPLISEFASAADTNLDCDCNNIMSVYHGGGTLLEEQDLKNVDDNVKYLIRKVSDCIRRLQTCLYPENEAMTVVNELLHALDECLKKHEFFQLFSDADFVRHLCMSFHRLSRSMRQDIHHVLNYHCLCFKQLLTQLNYSDDSKRKYFLKRFFNNLICSDSHDVHVQSNKVETDKLNNPGPSGLQPPLESNIFTGRQMKGADDSLQQSHCGSLQALRERNCQRNYCFPQRREYDLPTNLKEISFRGYPLISDKTLMLLQNMNLNLLDVTGTKVTRVGAQQFMAYNPQCRLIHETTCRCRPNLHF